MKLVEFVPPVKHPLWNLWGQTLFAMVKIFGE